MSFLLEARGIANVAYMAAIFTNGKIKRGGYLCSFSEFDFTGYSLACTGI